VCVFVVSALIVERAIVLSSRAQAVAQLLQWLVMFLLMFGTYLFQVGLLGVLAKEFRAATYTMPAYFIVWAAHTGYKLVRDSTFLCATCDNVLVCGAV